jgi:hypothetical protein
MNHYESYNDSHKNSISCSGLEGSGDAFSMKAGELETDGCEL